MIAPRSSRFVTALFFLFQATAFGASIGAVAISPGSTPAGITATVAVTAVISDPSIIGSTVILQRLDPQGRILATIGSMKDDGKAGDATASDGTYTIRFSIYDEKPGAQIYRVSAGVLGSLVRIFSTNLSFNVTGAFATGVTITQPANLAFVNTSPITVSGTTGDPTAAVQVNGIAAAKSGNTFQTTVPLQEGNNTIAAVAANSNGTTSSASIQVTLDTTPPHLSIDSPVDGSHTTEPNVTVTGLINDIVVGTVNSLQAAVTVNGSSAQVTNRTYSQANVPLQLGLNTIQVVGRDQTGNSATLTSKVTRDAITQPFIKMISGNNQGGAVGVQLPLPLVVQAFNGGTPLPNVPVLFKITENDGFLQPGTNKPQLISVVTNAQGQAQAFLTLGNRAGAGNNTVEAYAVGYQGIAQFVASGTPKQASKINVDSGNNQFGTVNQALALPFVGVVTDVGNNRLPNVPVTFTVKQGGGTMNGQTAYQTTSDGDGRVLAVLTLGSQPGQDGNVVDASFTGNTGLPATFTATGKIPGNVSLTTVSGVVLDNSNNSISGVTMRLFQTNQGSNNNQPMQVGASVLTGANGTFKMVSAPVGFFKLMADGSTATQGGKIYPTLEYDLITVAGQDNGVGMPIYLPALDPLAKVCVDATTGGELKVSSSPGFSLKILPGAATFPGGSKSGCVSVTPVNPDKVPMVPGFGQQPRYVVTIQPVGTMFNPPAAITIPNMDGLAPNAKTEMYSYDHDLAAFVAIGAGTVSGDGSIIASDPGVGVLKAGWHCGGNPAVGGGAETVTVTPSETKVVLPKGEKADLTATGAPTPIGNPAYTWTSADAAKATVTQPSGTQAHPNKGQITGVAVGKTTVDVKYTCKSGANATSTINVIVLEAKFEESAKCSGFDGSVKPPALMAPKGGTNTAKLTTNPGDAASELKLESAAAATADVTPVNPAASPETVTISGKAKGSTEIYAKPKSGPASAVKVATLAVDVKEKVTKTVAIHAITEENDDVQVLAVGATGAAATAVCVSEGANAFRDTKPAGDDTISGDDKKILVGPDLKCNTAANKTNLAPVNAPTKAALEAYLNDIWGKQANAFFTVSSRTDFTVNYDLNRDGGLADAPLDEVNAISAVAKDATVDINIYYVKKLEVPQATTIKALGLTWIQDDHVNSTVNVSAHEMGHQLGINYESKDAIDVMYEVGDAASPCNVKQKDWNKANP